MSKNDCLICQGKIRLQFQNLFDDRYGSPGKYDIYKCNRCGFGRLLPIVSSKKIGSFYAKYYPLSLANPKQVLENLSPEMNWKDWLNGVDNIAHKYIQRGSTVLDIGSASGQSLLEIKELGGYGYGVEPDPNGKKLAGKLKLNVWSGVLSKEVFPNKKFDFVTASQVLEHEEDPERFLKIAKEKLNKNGQIILAFPNADSLYRKIFGRNWINWHVPYHCNFFTKRSFIILANKNQLSVKKIRTITPTIWTVLQLRSFAYHPVEGQSNPLWSIAKIKPSSHESKNNRLFGLILHLLSLPIALFNRLIDSLGMGDSFLVFLTK